MKARGITTLEPVDRGIPGKADICCRTKSSGPEKISGQVKIGGL
jgi:hypothetical protein